MRATVGRILHFYSGKSPEPSAAIVTAEGDKLIHLSVFKVDGGRFPVQMPAESGVKSEKGYHWEWPPRV